MEAVARDMVQTVLLWIQVAPGGPSVRQPLLVDVSGAVEAQMVYSSVGLVSQIQSE